MEIATVAYSDKDGLWRYLLWPIVIEITYRDSNCGL